jgi:quinoprotein glucose dehydrogenase
VLRRGLLVSSLALAVTLGQAPVHSQTPPAYRGWPAYGGGPEGIRYSSLDEITRDNVRTLELAWSYDTGETGGLQTNPIVVGRMLFTTTPKARVIALDAATGALVWRFDSGIESSGPNRGVTYWSSGDDKRLFTTQGRYVYALDAASGRPIAGFGKDGRIDLHDDLGRPPDLQSVRLTTPGSIYKDLLIVGGRCGEGLPASPGHVRAYDVRSGTLRWVFHTIPQPGEPGYETWPKDAWTFSGGANNWAGMAVDEQRGIVFVPTGSAAADFYGANRTGDNLYANSLLALDAATGKKLWHFQAVRHDIWDRDFPAPPSLVTVTQGGQRIDAVAQTSKHGFVFLFERATGRSLFPIEYKSYPASALEGEVVADSQPLPVRPAPFSRQRLAESLLTERTPAARQMALEAFRAFRSEGQFIPFGTDRDTVILPGFDGGAEWGGSAFDPESGRLYVNANEMAWTGRLAESVGAAGARRLYLRDCAACHGDERAGAPPQIPSLVGIGARAPTSQLLRAIREGVGRMPGFPALTQDESLALVEYVKTGRDSDIPETVSKLASKYRFTGYKKFLDPEGYPAIKPPWGTLTAIDLGSGEQAWQVPLGEYPELAKQGLARTGSENYGGPVVTKGGLVFIGATCFDKKFRAFDKATGALLWETTLPFSAVGTPATYEAGGRQFVVVPAGGGKDKTPSGGMYLAFALPRRAQ